MVQIANYTDLITPQYKSSPKFIKWTEILLKPFIDAQNCALGVYGHYDVDHAIGKQLDEIGLRVGASRVLPFQPENNLSPILNNDDCRFLIKATIMRNHWDGTNEDLYEKWQALISDIYVSIQDNQDMSINVIFIGELSDIKRQMIENDMIIPRATGVEINFAYTQPPIFAFDQKEGYFQGWDIGQWLNG